MCPSAPPFAQWNVPDYRDDRLIERRAAEDKPLPYSMLIDYLRLTLVL